MRINIIVATDINNGIGFKGQLPWLNKGVSDLKYFREITSSTRFYRNAVVMGLKTFESLQFKPLKNRTNIVISKTLEDKYENVIVLRNPEDCFKIKDIDIMFIIGGSSIYEWFLTQQKHSLHTIYNTLFVKEYECDKYFSGVPDAYQIQDTLVLTQSNRVYAIASVYRKDPKHEEYQYINLIEHVMKTGTLKPNRTGMDTVSIFGHSTKWSLSEFPLLTTKKVFFRGIVEELLWFISGSTDSRLLEQKGVNIWRQNSSREYLDSVGLSHLPEGCIGAGYGFQWRNFGADFESYDTSQRSGHVNIYSHGYDQIENLVYLLKNDPNSRRILLCSWNPSQLKDMALPPCHVIFQLYTSIENDKVRLHSALYQRSADLGLGVPFNIASYALFTLLLCHCTDYEPGTFTHFTGDTHIYTNHIEGLKEQINRVPRPFPKLQILTENKDIFKFKYEDFKLTGYEPYEPVKLIMS